MDEISEMDKVIVGRAPRLHRFLSQLFFVAERFTGLEGKIVPLEGTILPSRRSSRVSTTTCPSRRSTWLAASIEEALEKQKKLRSKG